jgi:iron-sulfur cluster assembly protein
MSITLTESAARRVSSHLADQEQSLGIRVTVREEHLGFLQGMELDYVENGLSSAFHFNNPNVTEQCGCGESFTVN